MISEWLAHWIQQLPQNPTVQVGVGGGAAGWILWKSLAYWWSGFKRFPGSLLTAFLGTVLGISLIFLGWNQFSPLFPSTLFAAGAALGGCGILDLLAVLLTSKGKNIGAGWLGALFALVWTATLLLVGLLVSVFPLV
jgi:hypothetical protein